MENSREVLKNLKLELLYDPAIPLLGIYPDKAIIQIHTHTQTHTHTHTHNGIFRSQFSSVAQSCPILCNTMDCSTPGFPVYHQLPELAQTHVYRVSDAIQSSRPLSSPSPPAFNLSIRVFFSESVLCIRWPKYWSFSFSISPPLEYSGLISFKIDWFDLLAFQGTLKSLLQHQFKSINTLVLRFLYSPTLISIHDY